MRCGMRKLRRAGRAAIAGALLLAGIPARADIWDFDGEAYEESAGSTFAVEFNPEDQIYGGGFGWGLWLKNTPVFGDYFLTFFSNGMEDASYGALGLTLRLMPHWKVAPFVGAGGSYNGSASNGGADEAAAAEEDEPADRGDSYWGGHVEAGVRVWLASRVRLLELRGRYTWSSLEDNRGYWLIGIGTGTGF